MRTQRVRNHKSEEERFSPKMSTANEKGRGSERKTRTLGRSEGKPLVPNKKRRGKPLERKGAPSAMGNPEGDYGEEKIAGGKKRGL